MREPDKIAISFWANAQGREPVREFLQEQPKEDRYKLGTDIRKLQFGWPTGMPLVKHLGSSLWELRSSLASKREARIIFVAQNDSLIFLHGFIKKTQKTSAKDLNLARQRLKDLKL